MAEKNEELVEFVADYKNVEASSLAELDKKVKVELNKIDSQDLSFEPFERPWTYTLQNANESKLMFVQTMVKIDTIEE